MIIPTAEPFFFPGDRVGCLLVHGFTGTPKEMRWLGEYLAGQGRSVLGVRLVGHATQVEDMQRTRWEDWLACVEDGYHYLSGVADRVFVIGLSLGGALALAFANGSLTPGCPVAGVVAMASPQHLPIDPHLAPAIKFIGRFKKTVRKGPGDWQDEEAEKQHTSYDVYPVGAGMELKLALYEMYLGLPEVTAPTLLVYSKDDRTVRPEDKHAELIYEKLGCADKRLVWIEKSGHNLARDLQRETVFHTVGDFVDEISNQAERAAATLG
jgi:carboxylesterase